MWSLGETGCCAICTGEDRQRLHITDSEPAEGAAGRYDSPTSSTDEETAHLSVPDLWNQLTQKVCQSMFTQKHECW